MSSPTFQFRQFGIRQDRCAMKVGTDAVVLGSWAHPGEAQTLSDWGCGTGILALMLAQKSHGWVSAIDLDPDAVLQASENVAQTPWSHRITVIQANALQWDAPEPLDYILFNPPYHKEAIAAPNAQRALARSTSVATTAWIAHAYSQLAVNGRLACILPHSDLTAARLCMAQLGGWWHRITHVSSFENKAPNRILLEGGPTPAQTREDSLFLYDTPGKRSAAFQALSAPFYLS